MNKDFEIRKILSIVVLLLSLITLILSYTTSVYSNVLDGRINYDANGFCGSRGSQDMDSYTLNTMGTELKTITCRSLDCLPNTTSVCTYSNELTTYDFEALLNSRKYQNRYLVIANMPFSAYLKGI